MATNPYFNSCAVENTILNLLVASEKNYEYPSLQKEAVEVISNNVAKVVYETLKQKSIASSIKRCNLLKFFSNICQTGDYHFDKNNYKIYLKVYEQEFCKSNNSEVENLLCDITQELSEYGTDLKTDIIGFHKRKNARRKQRMKKMEFIKQKDQEKLCLTLGIRVPKNISHYETSENLINELLVENITENVKDTNKPPTNSQDSKEHREKQIKFCYSLINFGGKKDMEILESILQKVSRYKNFERFEIGFLMDLWLSSDQTHLDLNKIIIENFPFVLEKIIIQFCTEIVKLKDASDISRYFTDLETEPKLLRLRSVCVQNFGFYCKIKSLIFELYIFSFCNTNVYRFINYIL